MISRIKFILSLNLDQINEILAEVSSITGMPVGENIPSANTLLEMGKSVVEQMGLS